ncbi:MULTISPECIES: DUF5685 family protein [unclassified Ruminococcus]|uniref:DUF5685 family protein n=1 Tax=unclassified Ruminococcus TaxID=2608920 RepID=UPI00210B181A|nr:MULTISPECIES: DUF5685 family protein [unclassified Ruminococcus]MCQ4022528.1 hypothetical protein [Ruminococcus sp. zg-924]MCQ4115128.1 hypothetical protein [Ruminococcus sp. zg-921]
MFGYIRPFKPEMLIKDFDAYKAVYCSLCKQLGKDYGVCASLILSYDATLYAILSMSVRGECNSYKTGRCKVNPTKKCNYCQTESKALKDAAAVSIASFYHKLEDDHADGGFFKRLAVFFVKPVAKRWRKKLFKYGLGKFDEIFASVVSEQLAAEQNPECGIDMAAHPTAKALSILCADMSEDKTQRRVLEGFGYHLGRWVYLMDAADDLADDIKKCGFNPFARAFSLSGEYDKEEISHQCNSVINESAAMLLSSYNLIELKGNQRILENVVTLGISAMQKKVIFDNNKKKSNK